MTRDFRAILGTGSFPTLHVSRDRSELYVADSWLDGGPKQTRRDYVTIYDAKTWQRREVIEVPGSRRALMAPTNRSALTRDGRFLVIFNFKPATSVTVVDVIKRRVVHTAPTARLLARLPRPGSAACR